MTALPDPLTPADCDLRGLEYMPLLGASVRQRLQRTRQRYRVPVALTLWWAAWTQKPAASLPDDDARCVCADLGRDMRTWRKVKKVALHGFVKCSRRPALSQNSSPRQATIAWEKRVNDRKRKAEWRSRRDAERARQRNSILKKIVGRMHADATRTERSRHAETALNRRDVTGRDGTISQANRIS
jgi:hypothetical protein